MTSSHGNDDRENEIFDRQPIDARRLDDDDDNDGDDDDDDDTTTTGLEGAARSDAVIDVISDDADGLLSRGGDELRVT